MIRLLLLAGLLAALPLPAQAQDAATALSLTSLRVLHDAAYEAKADDGSPWMLRTTTTYDPVSGEYVRTITDATGTVVDRAVTLTDEIRPNAEEARTAEALISGHSELSSLIATADHAVTVAGGFPLMRPESTMCGPGSRCVQYDIYQVLPGSRQAERIRYVIVDLRALRVLDADFDLATLNPASDR